MNLEEQPAKPAGNQALDPRYLAFFDRFNRQRFYEAHEVLEDLWLEQRQDSDGAFYKGLIQIAGAFVHVQKHRPQPAAALLKLACTYLRRYPDIHLALDVAQLVQRAETWRQDVDAVTTPATWPCAGHFPQLELVASSP